MSVWSETQLSNPKPELRTMSEKNNSIIYSMLPLMVRSRVPALKSLRQTAYDIVSRPLLHSRSLSDPTSQVTRSFALSLTDDTGKFSTISGVPVTDSGRVDNNNRNSSTSPAFDATIPNQNNQTGGVNWFIAGVGVRLWLDARRQAELPNQDTMLLRSMYIDALKYMNMALPNDLSETEVATIQDSLPAQILALSPRSTQTSTYQRPNILRQSIAQAVCWSIAVLLIVIPLVMTAINRILVYEREHQITYRLLNGSSHVTRAIGKRGLVLGDTFVRFKDTPSGRTCLEFVSWVIEGVVGGVNDGLSQSSTQRARLLQA